MARINYVREFAEMVGDALAAGDLDRAQYWLTERAVARDT